MSELYLLDTNVVLMLVRGGPLGEFIDATFGLRTGKRRPVISVVTHGEVRVLASRNNWGTAKLTTLQDTLDALVTVDINVAEVIDAYVEIDIYSQQHPDGARNMGKNDLWIAACAKASGATLLTIDKDFDHLDPGLLTVKYIDPSSTLPSGSGARQRPA
jgi:tRNA(fMet)-specific endonuclease VapC